MLRLLKLITDTEFITEFVLTNFKGKGLCYDKLNISLKLKYPHNHATCKV